MKTLLIILICLAISFEFLSRGFGRKVSASDYDEILSYADRVEKNGFQRPDFDAFAAARRSMRKTVYLGTPLESVLDLTALALLAGALGIIIVGLPKK